MRAYIITTPDNHGRVADLTNYPSMLPTPELFFGVTPDTIEVPSWWLDIYQNKWKNDISERVYCCAKSKELLLRQHKEKFSNEDALLMEDDVMFTLDADEKFSEFIFAVPDDWKFLYLGGNHEFSCRGSAPREIKKGILRGVNILGTEALIIRANFIDTVIKQLTYSPNNAFGHCDWALVTLQRKYSCYAPLGFIAGQQDGWSELFQKERKVGFRNDFCYEGMDRKKYLYGRPEQNCSQCNCICGKHK